MASWPVGALVWAEWAGPAIYPLQFLSTKLIWADVYYWSELQWCNKLPPIWCPVDTPTKAKNCFHMQSDPGVLSLLSSHRSSLLFVFSVPTKTCTDQIAAPSTSVLYRTHSNTTETMTQTYTQGGVSFLWLMRAGMMGVRHVMWFIELGSLFKFNQELWLLMKISDRKSLW